MNRIQLEDESRFLERIARYREEYRSNRAAAVNDERTRRHSSNEVFIAGNWVSRADAERVARGVAKHELVTFIEIAVLLVLLVLVAAALWWLFKFLLLP